MARKLNLHTLVSRHFRDSIFEYERLLRLQRCQLRTMTTAFSIQPHHQRANFDFIGRVKQFVASDVVVRKVMPNAPTSRQLCRETNYRLPCFIQSRMVYFMMARNSGATFYQVLSAQRIHNDIAAQSSVVVQIERNRLSLALALSGRLLYLNILDNWQLAFFMKGLAATGKVNSKTFFSILAPLSQQCE